MSEYHCQCGNVARGERERRVHTSAKGHQHHVIRLVVRPTERVEADDDAELRAAVEAEWRALEAERPAARRPRRRRAS